MTLFRLNLQFCVFFTLVCDILSPNLTFLCLFSLVCDFFHLNLHFCVIFTLCCEFFLLNLQFCVFFTLVCDILSPKFTFLCLFFTSLWLFHLNLQFCVIFTLCCNFFQEGAWQSQVYKNRIPTTFTFCHLRRFRKCFTWTRLVWAIVIKILHHPIPASCTMWELHLHEMQWWTILLTTPSEYRGWCRWKVVGPGTSRSNHL